jgi:hypothetical protein
MNDSLIISTLSQIHEAAIINQCIKSSSVLIYAYHYPPAGAWAGLCTILLNLLENVPLYQEGSR